jgi:DNA invertase Pin-like site-specific DNA recombinase
MLKTDARPNVALYARVSTSDGRQSLENQLRELRRYARGQAWKIASEFTDEISGTKEKRPGLDELMKAAAIRPFEIVLAYDLSRMTRNGPASAFAQLERLKACRIEFWSYREEYFRTAGPAGPILIAIAAFLAEQEREQIVGRINAGIARAKAAGVEFGRPRSVIDRTRLAELRSAGKSLRECAQIMKRSKSTIERALAATEAGI